MHSHLGQDPATLSIAPLRWNYGAGRLFGSGILAVGNGTFAAVEARVFGALFSIASAAASYSANAFSSAVSGRVLSLRPMVSFNVVGIGGAGFVASTCQGGAIR